jgi:hypothetical protein
MNYFLNQLGAVSVGEAGAAGRDPAALDATINKAFNLGQTLADAIQTKRHYVDQESTIAERGVFFRQLVKANKEEWKHQYDFWMEKGWM